eukprot:CAMPEP_0172925324 /NCGR_PEP_ID=MMETSP1075-20121228/213500_1 /TAXON_ID=2916 /ORGANISM="Ceratium fusus, Strain PA161109" /LENGTH=231 /DNA_ID=CAMNT_0013786185 /DNA_START=34 /DNA_END=726 /DNA_ORIENTATION=-
MAFEPSVTLQVSTDDCDGSCAETVVRIAAANDACDMCEIRLRHCGPDGGRLRLAGQAKAWPAAITLADFLVANLASALTGWRVLELGCGLGLPGFVCAVLGADVLLTDVVEACPLLQSRVKQNAPQLRGTVQVCPLSWGADAASAAMANYGNYDLVICSDCVYEPLYGKSWRPLAESVTAFCRAGSVALVSVQRRDGEFEDAVDGVDKFLKAAEEMMPTISVTKVFVSTPL